MAAAPRPRDFRNHREPRRKIPGGYGKDVASDCRETSRALPGIPGDDRDRFVGPPQLPRRQTHFFGVRDRQRPTLDRIPIRGNRHRSAVARQELFRDAVRPRPVGEHVGRSSDRLAPCRAPARSQLSHRGEQTDDRSHSMNGRGNDRESYACILPTLSSRSFQQREPSFSLQVA